MGGGGSKPVDPSSRRVTTTLPDERPNRRASREDGAKETDRSRGLRTSYRAIRNPSELIKKVLTPQIVGRGFEVGAMKEHRRPVREGGREPQRLLRDGRLVVGKNTTEKPLEASPESAAKKGESAKPSKTAEAARVFAPSKSLAAGTPGGSPEAVETSLFEKTFLAHFEGGIPVANETVEKGKFHFLPKTEKAWAEFFQRFAAFALLKTVKAGDVQSLIFRGLMTPEGKLTKEAKALLSQAQAVLVSDLKFTDGKTDKFARIPVAAGPLLQILSKLEPGEPLAPEVFAELLQAMGGEDGAYIALSHKIVNPEMAKTDPNAATLGYQTPEKMRETAIREGVRETTPGIALSAKTEQLMAERLDIDLRSRSEVGSDRRAQEASGIPGPSGPMAGLFGKKKKRSGLWGNSAEEGYDGGSVFVPWYQHVFRPQKLKGKPRWWVAFLYAISGSVGLLAAYYVFRFWMQQ